MLISHASYNISGPGSKTTITGYQASVKFFPDSTLTSLGEELDIVGGRPS